MKLAITLSIATIALLSKLPIAHAQDAKEVIERSAHLINDSRWGEAVRTAEAAADRGTVHPDLSFNRGLAYLRRAQGTTAEGGDLGQAAAGFAEALQLRPEDAEAARGLEQVQLLVAQDRSKSDTSPESSSLGLIERVLLGIPLLLLVIVGTLGSLLATGGLVFRASTQESRRTTGSIVLLLGTILLLPSAAIYAARSALFDAVRVAVVIADQAEVVDDGGGRITGELPYRQGTILHIGPSERGLALITNLGSTARVPVARLRILADPEG